MDTCYRIYPNTDSSQKSVIVLIANRNRRRIDGIGGWDCGLTSTFVLGMVVGGGGRSTNRYKSSVAQMFIEITYVAFAFWEIWRLGDQEDRF